MKRSKVKEMESELRTARQRITVIELALILASSELANSKGIVGQNIVLQEAESWIDEAVAKLAGGPTNVSRIVVVG